MSDDELFRQDSGGHTERAVVDQKLRDHPSSKKGGPSFDVDHLKDRHVKVSHQNVSLQDPQLAGQRTRSKADLKAELEAISELAPVGWNLRPWKPRSLSREIQVRIQDAEAAVTRVHGTIETLSERVSVLCGEVDLTHSDDETTED
ncbi:hypothetical protein N9448_01425 [Litorivicinus sp.]|nr:hypothetical protein [Litorivicinus sp.]